MSEDHTPPPPSAWVRRCADLVPEGGRVLDVACGSGRHSRYFAERGHPVTAVDRDISRLTPHPAIEAVEGDLEDGNPWPFAGRSFAAIVGTNYLHRLLFTHFPDCLAPGGVLIWETFAAGNEAYGKPRNPEFLLKDGELIGAVSGKLRIVVYEAGLVHRPEPAVVQRIAAVKAAAGEIPAIPPPG